MVKVKSKALEPAESAELVQASTGGLNKVIIDRYLSLQQIQSRYNSALASERGDVFTEAIHRIRKGKRGERNGLDSPALSLSLRCAVNFNGLH